MLAMQEEIDMFEKNDVNPTGSAPSRRQSTVVEVAPAVV